MSMHALHTIIVHVLDLADCPYFNFRILIHFLKRYQPVPNNTTALVASLSVGTHAPGHSRPAPASLGHN